MNLRRGTVHGYADPKAAWVIRLCWIDWLTECSPHFDIQEMIEYCDARLGGSGVVTIRNALGRLGNEQASEDDVVARTAVVCFTFATEADRANFADAFADVIADHAIGMQDRA